ncbi:MAG: DUF1667 domain-containing protein [Anaerovoracaceae bacterium]
MLKEWKNNGVMFYDVAVVGGGPAGMAAAVSARENGAGSVVMLERDQRTGGVLNQCIHDGFGVFEFGESLTGPEYALRWKRIFDSSGAVCMCNAAVINMEKVSGSPAADGDVAAGAGRAGGSGDFRVAGGSGGSGDSDDSGIAADSFSFRLTVSSVEHGLCYILCRAVIMAAGCRERSAGQLKIPGARPAGVMTAGAAQYMMNVKNLKPGLSAVILGTGDVGLIMARRMTLEGIRVKMIVGTEPSGLMRNYIQCVKDLRIPLRFGCTVSKISGRKRITGVTVSSVNEKGEPVGPGRYIHCDTLIIAAGMIPERELWEDLHTPGVFFCGNVYKSYDTADAVSASGRNAGKAAADWLAGGSGVMDELAVDALNESRRLTAEEAGIISGYMEDFSGRRSLFCIRCPKGCLIKVTDRGAAGAAGNASGLQISGNKCPNGSDYALQEIFSPRRVVTSTVLVADGSLLPVKTSGPVPRDRMADVIEACRRVRLDAGKIAVGQVIIADVCGTGADLISTGEVG